MNKGGKRNFALRPKLLAVSVAACFTFSSSQPSANPSNPTVVQGVGPGGFSGLGTSALSVTTHGNAIINWGSFSIGVNEITRFLQQSAGNAVLNRVTGGELSSILGTLQSNGKVFLINPNGIVFGAGARIDVGGLVASSLDITNQDFIAGRLRFAENPAGGLVANHGMIETAAGGRVFLVAPNVENSGIIRAPQGEIVLAAGKSVELVSEASPFVTVNVAANEQALNVGSLIAESGKIGVYGALVRNAGVADASSAVAGPGGQIRFVAAKDLTVEAGSRVAANGYHGGDIVMQAQEGTNLIAGTVEATGSQGKGGNVQALGVRVGVIGNAVIDASGEAGGGNVLVGGDYQGKNPDVQNAERTLIGADGVIRADARTTGDGGRVIVWADGDTRFFGTITARGGSQSGNGGFVETSGKEALQALGRVDVGASNGISGKWLLDPTDITIVGGYYGIVDGGGTCNPNCFGNGPASSMIGVETIDEATGHVELQATGNITLGTHLVLDHANSDNKDFTARAGNNIELGAYDINIKGNLLLSANDAAYGSGSITKAAGGGNLFTNGGSVSLSGYDVNVGNINTAGTFGTGHTNVLVNADGTLGTGSITTGDVTGSGQSQVHLNAGYGGSITTGAIKTGSGGYYAEVYVNGAGAVDIASIETGSSQYRSYVEINTNTGGSGSITTGPIKTGDTTSGSTASSVELYSYSSVQVDGSIITGNSSVNSGVSMSSSSGGGITVTGAIQTGVSSGFAGVDVDGGGDDVTIGSISTSPGGASYDTYVRIFNANDIAVAGGITTGEATNIYTGIGCCADGGSIVALEASGSITTGGIHSGRAYYSAVRLNAGGAVTVSGGISTGGPADSSEGPTAAYISVSGGDGVGVTGQITALRNGGVDSAEGWVNIYSSNGNIDVGGINSGSAGVPSQTTSVGLSAYYGTVTVGSIVTGAATGWTYVNITGGTGIDVGVVSTGASTFGGSNVYMNSFDGGVMAGPITTGPAEQTTSVSVYGNSGIQAGAISTGASTYGGSSVYLESSGGGVTAGPIATGPAEYYSFVDVFAASDINVAGISTGTSNSSISSVFMDAGGRVDVGPIATGAANGSTDVEIYAQTGIGAGSITTGNSTYSDSYIYLETNTGTIAVGDAVAGIAGEFSWGSVVYYGGSGITAGSIRTLGSPTLNFGENNLVALTTNGDITVNGSIVTSGIAPSRGGGNVRLQAIGGGVTVNGSIDTRGAAGAAGDFSNYYGGFGGHVDILASGSSAVVNGSILTSGAAGATSGGGEGGGGGWGGDVYIHGGSPVPGSINIGGIVDTRGGAGGAATAAAYGGGYGGYGGHIDLFAMQSVKIGPTATPNVTRTVINTSGGAGGAGGPGGAGGYGGNAGNVFIDPTAIQINGVLAAIGGAGGAGSPAGVGGAGGRMDLLTINGAGTVTFVNGGFDLSGNPAGLATIDGTLIFLFAQGLVSDAVVQSITQSIQELTETAGADDSGGSGGAEDDDKKKKASTNSCKP